MRVTLLGTGCPTVDVHRYGPATLVESGAEAWLVDCGSGVTQRLLAHGRNGADLTGVLLTHLHSDHTVDLIQLLISGWHQGRSEPLRVYGPSRTREFLTGLLDAWEPELRQRIAHEMRPEGGLRVVIEEIDGQWRLESGQLSISNTEVRHPPIPQAFGFRFDEPGASAVISGDTAYCPELIELATGSHLLVHEAFVHWQYRKARPSASDEQVDNLRSYHTTTEEVGRVARDAGVEHVVMTHFVPVRFDRDRVVRDVRSAFDGGVSVGEDLMSFDVREGRVSLIRSGVFGHL